MPFIFLFFQFLWFCFIFVVVCSLPYIHTICCCSPPFLFSTSRLHSCVEFSFLLEQEQQQQWIRHKNCSILTFFFFFFSSFKFNSLLYFFRSLSSSLTHSFVSSLSLHLHLTSSTFYSRLFALRHKNRTKEERNQRTCKQSERRERGEGKMKKNFWNTKKSSFIAFLSTQIHFLFHSSFFLFKFSLSPSLSKFKISFFLNVQQCSISSNSKKKRNEKKLENSFAVASGIIMITNKKFLFILFAAAAAD